MKIIMKDNNVNNERRKIIKYYCVCVMCVCVLLMCVCVCVVLLLLCVICVLCVFHRPPRAACRRRTTMLAAFTAGHSACHHATSAAIYCPWRTTLRTAASTCIAALYNCLRGRRVNAATCACTDYRIYGTAFFCHNLPYALHFGCTGTTYTVTFLARRTGTPTTRPHGAFYTPRITTHRACFICCLPRDVTHADRDALRALTARIA